MKKKGLRRILLLGLVAILGAGWFAGYRAVNRWYAPLNRPSKTVTYQMGEWVPIGPLPENILKSDWDWTGYSYRVDDWKIMDTDAFLEEYQLHPHWMEEDIKPEKMLIATVTIANENNARTDFSLFKLDVETELSPTFLDEVLCAELNEGVESADVPILLTEEVTLTLPYGLRSANFSGAHWRNLEDQPFYMTFTMTNKDWEERIVPLN